MAPLTEFTLLKFIFFRWITQREVFFMFKCSKIILDIILLIIFFYKMIDFTKVYCKLHPYQLVNNFCAEKSCLVGLCPTCICQHTASHNDCRTQPQYQNIKATFVRVHEEIQDQIDTISKDKQRLSNIVSVIRDKKESFKGILLKARRECLKIVNDHFQELQKNWQNQMVNEQKKNSLHYGYRLQTIQTLISKQMGELIDESRKMNSINFVEQIPRITRDTLTRSKQFHRRVSDELEDNEKYSPIITYQQENLQEVAQSLKKLLKLSFSIPMKKYLTSSQSMNNFSAAITFSQQNQKRESTSKTSQIQILKRSPSFEKAPPQVYLSQSSFFPQVPIVLTNSYINSTPSPQNLKNHSEVIDKSRGSKLFFSPSYVESVDAKFSKRSIKPEYFQSNKKKSGLSLANQSQGDSLLSQKQNSRI